MTATYDPELPAALDRMRLRLGDTDVDPAEDALLPDETYLEALSLYGELEGTAMLAESLAAQYGQEPDSIGLDGNTYSWRDRVRTWLELAERLRAEAALTTSEETADAVRQVKVVVGLLETRAPIAAPAGWPDANSGAYRGDPYTRPGGGW